MIFIVAIALMVGGAIAAPDNACEGLENGEIPVYGCRSYTICFEQNEIQIDCPEGFVFNVDEGQCDDPENTPAPCGLWRDCAGRTGQYADLELDCEGYYTCNDGAFMGHIMCAEGTVFDERDGSCTWPFLVPAPCGTCSDCE